MAQITITINQREYPIACEDGQEARILQLANVLDEKAKMFAEAGSQISESMLLAMVGLLLADELSEIRKAKNLPENPTVQTVDKNRILEIDSLAASMAKNLQDEINSVAKKLELL